MPVNELEIHPFLNMQIDSENFKIANTRVMIIGTFPIYEITSSIPTALEGIVKRESWVQKANFKFYYGSKKNSFWSIISSCFNSPIPRSTTECISLLNQHGLFLSDTIKSTYRSSYSPSDKNLMPIEYNTELINLISEFNHLSTICFTSDLAKTQFCSIFNIPNQNRVQVVSLYERDIVLKTLPTPAGFGRTVRHFINTYPLTDRENLFRNSGERFALEYRKRIYCESISDW